jgi:signal transduction histidine kinase
MSAAAKRGKSTARGRSQDRVAGRVAKASRSDANRTTRRQRSSAEAQETVDAIRAGQVDALVIQGEGADRLVALRSFAEIERTQAALKNAGASRRRSRAQLKALAEERERLFQDMHDGCIQSIYAVALNLETCMRLIEENPRTASQMVAEATASLNLVIQELRAFITGHRLQIGADDSLQTAIVKAVQAARNHGLTFAVDIDEGAAKALTAEQALHLLQIARESISNATRHANARTGRVSLQRRGGLICLEVSDDGSGFVAKKVNRLGLGLHHIDARARKLGGKARIISGPNLGTRVVVEFREELVASKRR